LSIPVTRSGSNSLTVIGRGGSLSICYYEAFEKTCPNHKLIVCSSEVKNGVFYTFYLVICETVQVNQSVIIQQQHCSLHVHIATCMKKSSCAEANRCSARQIFFFMNVCTYKICCN